MTFPTIPKKQLSVKSLSNLLTIIGLAIYFGFPLITTDARVHPPEKTVPFDVTQIGLLVIFFLFLISPHLIIAITTQQVKNLPLNL